jgi:hypothetical protein
MTKIGYLDWVQRVLLAVLEDRLPERRLTIGGLAHELGLRPAGQDAKGMDQVVLGLDHVLVDLARHGLVTYRSDEHAVGYPPTALRFRRERLTSIWSQLRGDYLEPDDESFLIALADESERPADGWADVVEVSAESVFAELGWAWKPSRANAIYSHLSGQFLIEGRQLAGSAPQMRITFAGLVRARDDTSNTLREAEEHFHAGRLRAAGCIASVELERRLKRIVAGRPLVSARRDAQLEDYNKAAFDKGFIDQEAWRSITALAVIRKTCVHVLDREPGSDEVRQLIDGVERFLRRYPAPPQTISPARPYS